METLSRGSPASGSPASGKPVSREPVFRETRPSEACPWSSSVSPEVPARRENLPGRGKPCLTREESRPLDRTALEALSQGRHCPGRSRRALVPPLSVVVDSYLGQQHPTRISSRVSCAAPWLDWHRTREDSYRRRPRSRCVRRKPPDPSHGTSQKQTVAPRWSTVSGSVANPRRFCPSRLSSTL